MLTREQVSTILTSLTPTVDEIKLLLAHDAALRAEVERLTEERDQWKSWCEQTPSADMVRQLAQVQQELASYKTCSMEEELRLTAEQRDHLNTECLRFEKDLATAQADLSELQALHRDKYDRWKQAQAEVGKLKALVHEVFHAGVEFEDERVRWKTVQIDRTWFDDAKTVMQEAQRGGG